MGRKRTACDVCASIKALCSKGNPCLRCERLSICCSYPDFGLASGPKRLSTKNSEHTRSKTGCLNCRRRRKKCDEQQPTCSDCQRLGLNCVSRAAGKLVHTQPILDHANVSNPSGPESQTNNISLFFEGEQPSPIADWIALIDRENTTSLYKPANLADSVALVDLPVPCPIDDEIGYATYLPATALSNLTGITLETLSTWSIGERHLLNHFLQSVSRILVLVEDEDNPFLRIIVPMALESTMVRHSLVALSACHISRVYPSYERAFLFHRSFALHELKAGLNDSESIEWALATTLLLCLSEICESDSKKWVLHLHGANALLNSKEPGSMDATFDFLVELHNYLCCIASVTSQEVPSMRQDDKILLASQSWKMHPFMGMSTLLYQYLPSISQLGARKLSGLSRSCHQGIAIRAKDIELELQRWAPDDLGGTRLATEARAAAFAMQWAMLLRLNQTVRQLRNDDAQITKAADNILSALSLIRPGSEVEAHILFPLFMAGVGSMTKANRLTVEYRMNIMETTVGFGNIHVAHRLLDELWRQSNEGNIMDWEDLMVSMYPGLVLF